MSLEYSTVAEVYDELYGEEQYAKHAAVLGWLPPREPVLDVGCGTGLLFERLGCYAVGLDLSAGMLNVARKRAWRGDLVRSDAKLMPFRDESFQTVYSVTVIHEAPSMVGEVVRVLKPGGSAAITLLKKKLELLPLVLAGLPGAEVHDFEELKDLVILYRKTIE